LDKEIAKIMVSGSFTLLGLLIAVIIFLISARNTAEKIGYARDILLKYQNLVYGFLSTVFLILIPLILGYFYLNGKLCFFIPLLISFIFLLLVIITLIVLAVFTTRYR
jgi:hypothetical protein